MSEIVLEAQKKLAQALKKDPTQIHLEKQKLELKEMKMGPLERLHQTVLTQGKHKGETFQKVYQTDKQYIKWLSERQKLVGHSLQLLVVYAARVIEDSNDKEIHKTQEKTSESMMKDKVMEAWEEIKDEDSLPMSAEGQLEMMELMENQASMNHRMSRLETVLDQVVTMLQNPHQSPPDEQ